MTNYHHLNKEQRNTINILLNKNQSFTEIGLALNLDRTTISKEIRRNRYVKVYQDDYFNIDLINKAVENCKKLQRPPYVCNTCLDKHHCLKKHLYYDSNIAHKHYKEKLVNSRSGIDIPSEVIEEIEKQIVPLIKDKKQSINQVYINHKDILYFSKVTFYKYINDGVFSLTNMDLPKKVKFKKRKTNKSNENKRNLALLNGRRYEDFVEYTSKHPNFNIVEMDTVIGKRESSKALLTLYIRETHFMLIFLLNKKNSENVNCQINYLKEQLGSTLYSKIFKIILTDNGSEFFSVLNFERDFTSTKKISSIFYCHPYSSYEKHGVEVNHEYIRRVLPKGTSFDNLTTEIVKKLQDNINAIPRMSLNGSTPYDLTKEKWPDFIEKLSCKYIAPDEVTLSIDDISFVTNQ